MKKYKVYFDGNKTKDGVSCSYLIIDENEKRVKEETITLPNHTTVPEAEYNGLINALNSIEDKNSELQIFGDSQLIVYQITGKYECKKLNLRFLRSQVRNLLNQFAKWNITWIRRENNLVG